MSTEFKQELDVRATQIQAKHLEQEAQVLETQQQALGITTTAPEVAPGIQPSEM